MQTIQILGPGCPRCNQLAEHAMAAVSELGLACNVEKVTDIAKIAAMGVMVTPGFVLDGDVKTTGKVLSVDEIKEMLG